MKIETEKKPSRSNQKQSIQNNFYTAPNWDCDKEFDNISTRFQRTSCLFYPQTNLLLFHITKR